MNEESLVKTLLEARVRLIAGASVVLRDLHQAEDVFQEVLVRALRMRESFLDEAGLLAWARVSALLSVTTFWTFVREFSPF